jgi:hypothetical protein
MHYALKMKIQLKSKMQFGLESKTEKLINFSALARERERRTSTEIKLTLAAELLHSTAGWRFVQGK